VILRIFSCLKYKKLETEKDKKEQEISGLNGVLGSREDCFIGESHHEIVENNFHAQQGKIVSRKKILHSFGLVVIFIMMLIAGVAVYFRDSSSNRASAAIEQVATENANASDQDNAFVNDVSGTSIGIDGKGIAGKSESYLIRDISIGGGNVVLALGMKWLRSRLQMFTLKH